MLTTEQIRMARTALRWSTKKLSNESGVSHSRIRALESTDGIPNVKVSTLIALITAFEATGKIEFLEDNGVRLKDVI